MPSARRKHLREAVALDPRFALLALLSYVDGFQLSFVVNLEPTDALREERDKQLKQL